MCLLDAPASQADEPFLSPSVEVETSAPQAALSPSPTLWAPGKPCLISHSYQTREAGGRVPILQMRKLRLSETKGLPSKLYSRKGTRPYPFPTFPHPTCPRRGGRRRRKEPTGKPGALLLQPQPQARELPPGVLRERTQRQLWGWGEAVS